MTRVIEVPLEEGGSILVEVDETPELPVTRGLGSSAAAPPVSAPLEQMLAGLGPATRALIAQVRTLADSPHEVELEFAVKLTAEAKIVIARVGGEANFRIALRWTRPPDDEP